VEQQIQAIEMLSAKPVVAVAVNREDLTPDGVHVACADITATTGLPAFDVLGDGARGLAAVILSHLESKTVAPCP
jgi:uncharacterized NAD-dependent epimerase/dehydratase family protein